MLSFPRPRYLPNASKVGYRCLHVHRCHAQPHEITNYFSTDDTDSCSDNGGADIADVKPDVVTNTDLF